MVVPLIDITRPDPLAAGIQGFLTPVQKSIREGLQRQQLQNLAGNVDFNNPAALQQLLLSTPASLRPELLTMLQTSNLQQQRQEQATSAQQKQRINELQIQDIEAKRDTNFTNIVNDRFNNELDRGMFIDMSQKYKNELNPEIRFQKTYKDFQRQNKIVNEIGYKLGRFSTLRKGVTGLSDAQLSQLSDSIQRARQNGVDERLLENTVKNANLTGSDTEAVLSPNYGKVKNILSSIKPLKRLDIGETGTIGIFPRKASQTELINVFNKVKRAIQLGGTLNLIYTTLRNSGYNEGDAQRIITEATTQGSLTAKQELQLNNLRKRGRSLLGGILGF